MARERIVDIRGQLINPPKFYNKAKETIEMMIDKMEADNVDRADMYIALRDLFAEADFHLRFLPNSNSSE
jgi:hypothetical protein